MIILNQGQDNVVYAVASRNKIYNGGSVYLFAMYNKLSEEKFRFIPYHRPYNTIYPPRLDEFEVKIDFNSPPSLTGNTSGFTTNVWLTEGEYYYKIYQQNSASNLNTQLATDVVDEGMMYVASSTTDMPVFDNDNYYMKVFEQ